MRFIKAFPFIVVFLTIIISGCKKWDDHTAVDNPDLAQDLYTAVSGEPKLTRFAEFRIGKAGGVRHAAQIV